MSIDSVNGYTGKCKHCRFFAPIEKPERYWDGLCFNREQWPKSPGKVYSGAQACFKGELRDDLKDEVQMRLEDFLEEVRT